MDAISLSQLVNQINQHIFSLETLEHYLQQAESLIHVATTTEFVQAPKRIMHNYLWTLSNTIECAQKLNERISCDLYK